MPQWVRLSEWLGPAYTWLSTGFILIFSDVAPPTPKPRNLPSALKLIESSISEISKSILNVVAISCRLSRISVCAFVRPSRSFEAGVTEFLTASAGTRIRPLGFVAYPGGARAIAFLAGAAFFAGAAFLAGTVFLAGAGFRTGAASVGLVFFFKMCAEVVCEAYVH